MTSDVPTRSALLLLALLAPATAGCRKKPKPLEPPAKTTSVTSAPSAPSAKASTSVEPLAPPRGTVPGAVYFDHTNGISYILEDGSLGDIRGSYSHLTRGADGKAYAVSGYGSSSSIVRLERGIAKQVSRSPIAVWSFAVAADGTLVVFGDKRAARYDGQTWKQVPCEVTYVSHVEALPTGGAIFASSASIVRFDGTSCVEEKRSGTPLSRGGLLPLGDKLLLTDSFASREMDASPKAAPFAALGASITYAAGARGLVLFNHFQAKTQQDTTWLYGADGHALEQRVSSRDALLDDSGRTWKISDGVLTVRPLFEGEPTVYPIGTLAALDDFTSGMMLPERGVVLAGGPKLPPVGEVRRSPRVTGRITIGGRPAANVPFEICLDAGYYGNGSPCAGKASKLTATTDEKGGFTFTDVPLGSYDLTLKTGGKWSVDHVTELHHFVAGKPKDVGTIRYR